MRVLLTGVYPSVYLFDVGDLVTLSCFGCDGVGWHWMVARRCWGFRIWGLVEGWRELGLDER